MKRLIILQSICIEEPRSECEQVYIETYDDPLTILTFNADKKHE